MSAPTSGLSRVTIRTPRRRLDLAVPHQVPLAELLPEVLRRAGEAGGDLRGDLGATQPVGGWVLRRGDGAGLNGDMALAQQGIRDGDVLYLVPRQLAWAEPHYDDVIEEAAAGARRHGRAWDAAATRLVALVASGLVMLTGLGLLVAARGAVPGAIAVVISVVLLGAGSLLSRALGDGVAGATVAGLALPHAAAGALLLMAARTQAVGPSEVLVAASALLLASVVGGVAVGFGLRIFAAGVTAAVFAGAGALLALAASLTGAAAILVVALVAGVGLAPLVAVRLGKIPLPVVTADPAVLAAERRPDRSAVYAAVVRADEILAGALLGIAVVTFGCVAVLAATTGIAGPLLAGLGSAALLLRARVFPSIATRLPLLASGIAGLALTAWGVLAEAGSVPRLIGVAVALVAVVGLLGTAVRAHSRVGGGSVYLARLCDILDVVAVVALAPVACAVLDLYSWVRGLAG